MSKGSPKGSGKRRPAQQVSRKAPPVASSKTAPLSAPSAPATTAASVPSSSRGATGSRPKSAPRRRRSRVNWIWVVAGVGALALIGALVYNIAREVQVIAGVQTYGPFPANVHVNTDVTYQQVPPVGGEHRPSWQNCGIYNSPVQDEFAVHALEHGAVWITYQPDLPAEQVERLKGLVRGKTYTLLSPHAEQTSPVAASAWGLQLLADSADDARLGQFVSKYRQGSQTPEAGASCVGGVGSPDER
jgi:hypothetical protein